MAVNKRKQKARWKRNKADQRLREREAKPTPRPIDPEVTERVWAERDKRLRNFPWDMPRAADGSHYRRRTRENTYPLVCDVWAVKTLMESQDSFTRITDGMIAKALWDMGKNHGLKKTSLRTKVWVARQIISHLESAPARDFRGAYWPKFPDSVADHGSGVMQHVNIVLRILGKE